MKNMSEVYEKIKKEYKDINIKIEDNKFIIHAHPKQYDEIYNSIKNYIDNREKIQKKTKTEGLNILIISIIIVLFVYWFNWYLFDIDRLKGQELLKEESSPNSNYKVECYLNNGGATVDFAVLCKVIDNKNKKERNIYWEYHCSEAEVTWKDETTVIINEMELDVLKDTYDFRKK